MIRRTASLAALAVAASLVAAAPLAAAPRTDDRGGTYGSVGVGDPYFPKDGNGGIDVQSYDVRVRYEFGPARLSGTTRIELRATETLAGFNLVAVNGGAGTCFHWDGTLRPVRFGAGLHVVSNNRDLDDAAMPEKTVVDAFSAARAGLPDEVGLQQLLRSHDGEQPICKHNERYGTVSSTIYVERRDGPRLLYADGGPCQRPFADYSGLLETAGAWNPTAPPSIMAPWRAGPHSTTPSS